MGKSALLLVIVSLYSWTLTNSNQKNIFLEREDEQAFYEEKVLAREQALSGFDMVVSNTVSDFDNFRIDLLKKPYRDGNFSMSALSSTNNVVTVLATGTVGRAEYSIIGDMIERGGTKMAALNIDGPISSARGVGGSYLFTGVNTNPDDLEGMATGQGPNASGVHTVLESARIEMEDGLRPELVTGGKIGAGGSFTYGENEFVDFDRLSDTILSLCDVPNPVCIMMDGNQIFAGNDVFGTREEPVIVIVDGNATFRGNIRGYGVLYIKGNFNTEVGQPRWEGLIYASTSGGQHELRGQPKIYGAIVLRSTDTDGNPVATVEEKEDLEPISFTVRGEPQFFFSSLALSRLSFLSAELTTMLKSEPIRVELTNVRQAAGNMPTSYEVQ